MYHTYSPSPPLAAFVRHFWLYETEAATGGRERRLPSGALDLVITLRDEPLRVADDLEVRNYQHLGLSVVSGAYARSFVIDMTAQTSLIGISFKPGGAAPFFALPVNELANKHVPLETLWGSFAHEVRERLLALSEPHARLCLFEHLLLRCTRLPLTLSPLLIFALSELQQPSCVVGEISSQSGYSARHFAQIFSASVGLTPKQFYRVRRLQAALNLIAKGGEMDWSDLAAACGYFDQAHFIHDFRAFAGLTPGAYFSQPRTFRNHIPLSV